MSIYSTDPTGNSRGFNQIQATILSVTSGKALCQDKLGRLYPSISVTNMVGSGSYPQAGESWMLSKANGGWTFFSRVTPVLPVVTNSSTLVQALVAHGDIDPTSTVNLVSSPSPNAVTVSWSSPYLSVFVDGVKVANILTTSGNTTAASFVTG